VERFYSLFTFILAGAIIVLIWKELTNTIKSGWIPLLFWVTVSIVLWACPNNMLENTMTVFVCLSVLFYIKHRKNHSFLMLLFSGLALSLAVLTKGFIALYIWALPFFDWIINRGERFINMSLKSALVILSTVIPIALLFIFSPEASENMINYFNLQVLDSLQNAATVNSRFAIIGYFFMHIVAPLLIAILFIVIHIKRKRSLRILSGNIGTSLLFMLIVLSGIVPIMISMKQRGFYILTVYPFFAISVGYLLLPIIEALISEIKENAFKILTIITYCMITVSLGLSAYYIISPERIGRDKNKILDCYEVIDEIGTHQVVNMCPSMYTDWSLHGYFTRYGNISLDVNLDRVHHYYLTKDRCGNLSDKEYNKLDIMLFEYELFERITKQQN
jgi:4-amino-4-deoxy-L-arabinose transferase-like glycosyltransferase